MTDTTTHMRAFIFKRSSYPGGTGIAGFFVGDGSSPVQATFIVCGAVK